MIASQKNPNDTQGFGFEKGKSSKLTLKKNNSRRPPVRKPNVHEFNGNYFVFNKFGHMASQCRNKMINNDPSFIGQCFKCNKKWS